MKFKDLKLGLKLGISFALLIMISAILGFLAIINMETISDKSGYIESEYVPEIEVTNNIERNALLTMYNMRGYGYTEDKKFLTQGQEYLGHVKNYMNDAKLLADNSPQLVKLKSQIDKAITEVNKYETLVQSTVIKNEELASLRNNMDKFAVGFITNCSSFLESQNNSLDNEINRGLSGNTIDKRHTKITLINDIIDKGNALRIANFKGQAMRDPKHYEDAINSFNIKSELREIRDITILAADIAAINEVEKSANEYVNAMNLFLSDWKDRESINTARNVAGGIVLSVSQTTAAAAITHTKQIAKEAVSLLGTSSVTIFWGLVIALIIGVVLAIFITRLISLPLQKGVVFAQEIASGNLMATIDVNQKDEIGQLAVALNTMVEKLKNIMANVQSGADQIASASEESSSSSQEMSEGANEQASSIEEVSATMEEMTANMQQSSSNSQQTEQIALKAAKDIKVGSEAVTNTVESMKIIADKISIITEIANQTNMLALNAAVEAARAGKKGKGFAVVATEVKQLAERSAKAAEEIDKVSAESVLVAENAGNMLTAIVPDIEKTSVLVAEITSAIAEQSASSEQISNSIDEMNKVTQQNSAVSEELASSAEELAAQSDLLKETIAFFDIGNVQSIGATSSRRKNYKKMIPAGNGNGNNPESSDKGVKLNLHQENIKDEEFERY